LNTSSTGSSTLIPLYGAGPIDIPTNTAWGISVTVTGVNMLGTVPTQSQYTILAAYAHRGTGASSITATTTITNVTFGGGVASAGPTIVATGNGIAVTVTPSVANTRWNATIQVTSIGF